MQIEKGALEEVEERKWQELIKELMNSGVTKEQFKQFIEVKKREKNLLE